MAIYDKNGSMVDAVYSLTDEISTAYDVRGNVVYTADSRPKLVVMSFNIQKQLQMNTKAFQVAMIQEYKPDIIGMQEYRTVNDDRYDDYSYETNDSAYVVNYNGVLSKYPFTSTVNSAFVNAGPSGDNQGYNAVHFEVGGKDILLVNTHLSFNDATRRKNQSIEVYNMVTASNADGYIITADFNTYILSASYSDYTDVYKQFADIGCNFANNGTQYGFTPTWYNGKSLAGSSEWYCLDSIITSPNIEITSSKIDKSKLTLADGNYEIDHLPVIATLRIGD